MQSGYIGKIYLPRIYFLSVFHSSLCISYTPVFQAIRDPDLTFLHVFGIRHQGATFQPSLNNVWTIVHHGSIQK